MYFENSLELRNMQDPFLNRESQEDNFCKIGNSSNDNRSAF